MAQTKGRQLNYELLRIAAMLMIVCLHYLSKGGLLTDPAQESLGASDYAAWLIEAFCLAAVNVYVLISGYFGAESMDSAGKNVWKRPLAIWKQVFFYSAAIGALACLFGGVWPDIYTVFTYLFPIVTEHYWFATSYIILCLFMPFLNRGVRELEKKELEKLIGAFLLIFCIAKTVIPMQLPWDNGGYDPFWFVTLYLTGAYIRRYGLPFAAGKLKSAALYAACALGMFASLLLLRRIYLATGRLEEFIHYAYTYNHLFCYLGAIGLFACFGFLRIPERARKPIESVAGASFGVYLIHEHIDIRYLWTDLFDAGAMAGAPLYRFLGRMLVAVLLVYAVCTLIELARRRARIKHILAAVLCFWPMRHAFTGIDLMDAGYALGNYRFFDEMDPMWRLATYLSNAAGLLISKLPGAGTWAGMNLYCGALIGAAAAAAYLYLCRMFEERVRAGVYLMFAAELAALSLCWAPGVVLYHYLGYLLMTIAVLVLYRAIVKDSRACFAAAGVLLGICVAVRMPNITYMALILPLWYSCLARGEKPGRLVSRTLYCVGGYAAGLAATLGYICIRYGVSAYPEMVAWLFGMTDTATDYKPASMLAAMFGDYAAYSVWLLLFAVYGAAGALWFWITGVIFSKNGSANKKITLASEIIYVLGMAVLLRLCYGRGMFDFDYTAFFSMYKWATVYLLLVLLCCVWTLVSKKTEYELKLWAVFLPVIIFITPLGSNNGLYPIINNLFLIAPVSVVLFGRLFGTIRAAGRLKPGMSFAAAGICVFALVCTAAQGILFGACFVFHDQKNPGEEREAVELSCSGVLSGMKTTVAKKEALEGLDCFLYESGLNSEDVILYGNIPAVAYIFDMEPAIFTTWPDLDSNGIDRLTADLDALYRDGETPVVIFGLETLEKNGKYEAICAFMEQSGYEKQYENGLFAVYSPNSNICLAKSLYNV